MVSKKKDTGLFEVNLKEPSATIFLLFIQTADAVQKYSEAILTKAGLSIIKMMVLQLLDAHGGSLTPSEIARLVLREKHNITTLIRRMQKDRLIKIKADTKDRRSINVIITKKGQQALINITPVARTIVKTLMSSIPDSAAAGMEEPLKTLRQNAYQGLVKGAKRG